MTYAHRRQIRQVYNDANRDVALLRYYSLAIKRHSSFDDNGAKKKRIKQIIRIQQQYDTTIKFAFTVRQRLYYTVLNDGRRCCLTEDKKKT